MAPQRRDQAPPDPGKLGAVKILWLPFLICCAPALTALWMSGILMLVLAIGQGRVLPLLQSGLETGWGDLKSLL